MQSLAEGLHKPATSQSTSAVSMNAIIQQSNIATCMQQNLTEDYRRLHGIHLQEPYTTDTPSCIRVDKYFI